MKIGELNRDLAIQSKYHITLIEATLIFDGYLGYSKNLVSFYIVASVHDLINLITRDPYNDSSSDTNHFVLDIDGS